MNRTEKSEVTDIQDFKHEKLLEVKWGEKCGNLIQQQHNLDIEETNKAIHENHPEKVIIDLQECSYFATPENYRWYENMLFSKFESSPQTKIAIVVPHNLWVHVAFEANHLSLQQKERKLWYFNDLKKAKGWLDQ